MGNAVVAGLVIAAIFIIALLTRPVIVLAIIVVILALAAWEYFGKITDKGYRPAVAPGLAACVCAPLAAYWLGDGTLPLVVAFAFMAGAIGFIGAHGVESGPLPNMAVTTMGVVWIGLLGGYAALILRFSTAPEFGLGNDVGTDTLFMLALGVAANDVGALVVGSAVGRTPMRPWVSPNKTLEGLLGGALVTIIALFIASKINTEEHVQAQPRHQGLRDDHPGPRRDPRPLRRIPLRPAGRVLLHAGHVVLSVVRSAT
jgi:phosphatidate cytidylyltransferase